MEKLIITPNTKIYDLLESYPELEDDLIQMAPPFRKLKNPVLRKTIARVTSLSQAAVIGGISVDDLVNDLRKKAGQDVLSSTEDEIQKYNTDRPNWFDQKRISKVIDVREFLDEGEQPIHEVITSLKKLKAGEILELMAPFVPAPLIDKATSLGYEHWIDATDSDDMSVFFKG